MPTTAKLVAALISAMTGYLAAHVYFFALPEGTQIGIFRETCAVIGILSGWFVLGGRAGTKGYVSAMGTGVRASVTTTFFSLLLFSIVAMLKKSTKMVYDGPMEAVMAIFEYMLEYGELLKQPMVLAILLVGGLIGGILAEFSARQWR